MSDHVPMKFKYEPCCGVARTPDKDTNFLNGGELRKIACHNCGLEFRLPVSIPEYKLANMWNKSVSGER